MTAHENIKNIIKEEMQFLLDGAPTLECEELLNKLSQRIVDMNAADVARAYKEGREAGYQEHMYQQLGQDMGQ